MLFDFNCIEFTYIETDTTANTFILNDKEWLKPCSVNCINRTFGSAGCASGTLFNIN